MKKRKLLTHLYAPSALYRIRNSQGQEKKLPKVTMAAMLADGSYPLPRGATLPKRSK